MSLGHTECDLSVVSDNFKEYTNTLLLGRVVRRPRKSLSLCNSIQFYSHLLERNTIYFIVS